MPNSIIINKKIKKFNSLITVSGDKSISIRWVLFSSLASGISEAKNLLMSEDVMAAINAIKNLGIKSKITKKSNENTIKDLTSSLQPSINKKSKIKYLD